MHTLVSPYGSDYRVGEDRTSFSYAPDFVKRRRRTQKAVDPCLGYYMQSPSPPAAQLEGTVPCKTDTKGSDEAAQCSAAKQDVQHEVPHCTAAQQQRPKQVCQSPKSSPAPNQVTVEAFLLWSTAAPTTMTRSTRRKRKFADLYALNDDTHPQTPGVPPTVRRYRRRRLARDSSFSPEERHYRSENNKTPGLKKKAKPSNIFLRSKRGDRACDSETRRPLDFMYTLTPPGTPKLQKWRMIDPHISAKTLLPVLGNRYPQSRPSTPKQKRFSRWQSRLSLHTAAQLSAQDNMNPVHNSLVAGQRPGTTRLEFIPLNEHEERLSAVFHHSPHCITRVIRVPSESVGDNHPCTLQSQAANHNTAVSTVLDSPRYTANVQHPSSMCLIENDPKSPCRNDPPLLWAGSELARGNDGSLPGFQSDSCVVLVPDSSQRCSSSLTAAQSDSSHCQVSCQVADYLPPPEDSSQALPIAADGLPVAAIAPSPDRSPLSYPPAVNHEAAPKLLRPIGSFLDGFREIARAATHMNTKAADNGEDDPTSQYRPQGSIFVPHVTGVSIPTSSGLLSPGNCVLLLSRLHSGLDPRSVDIISASMPPAAMSSLNSNRGRARPRCALSQLRRPSEIPRHETILTVHCKQLHESKDIDIVAALRPQTSQVFLDAHPHPHFPAESQLRSFGSIISSNDGWR